MHCKSESNKYIMADGWVKGGRGQTTEDIVCRIHAHIMLVMFDIFHFLSNLNKG